MKKTIGIDLDSTLNTLDKDWLDIYNEEYNDHLTVKDIKSWNTYEYVKPECGKKIYEIFNRPGFFRNLGIREHAKEVIEEMISHGHKIYIVTAYHPEICMDKANWLKEHLPLLDIQNLIFCNDKGRFSGDFLIDDGGHNIEAFASSNPNGIPLVYDGPCPWNHYLGEKFPRVKSWPDIRTMIKNYN